MESIYEQVEEAIKNKLHIGGASHPLKVNTYDMNIYESSKDYSDNTILMLFDGTIDEAKVKKYVQAKDPKLSPVARGRVDRLISLKFSTLQELCQFTSIPNRKGNIQCQYSNELALCKCENCPHIERSANAKLTACGLKRDETMHNKSELSNLLNAMFKEARDLIWEALITDGAHHKQWYIQEIAKTLDIKLPESSYEPGIAP